jgi:hypothetical protein
VLSADDPIVEWIGGTVIVGHSREVELRRGVWRNGRYSYEEFNSALRGDEELPIYDALRGTDAAGQLTGIAVSLAMEGSRSLVFVRDRPACRRCARTAAAALRLNSEPRDIPQELEDLPHTSALAVLLECASQGVAFHNSDLTSAERAAVESLMRRGELQIVFSTPTLATGVNFPVDNVLIESHRWEGGEGLDPLLRRLKSEEFESCAGRCARYGMSSVTGRAVMVATGEGEEHLLWHLIGPGPSAGAEVFRGALADRVFALLYGLGPITVDTLVEFLNDPAPRRPVTRHLVTNILEWLKGASLAVCSDTMWKLGRLGALVARSPFCAESGATLCERLSDPKAPRTLAGLAWTATGLREFASSLPSCWNADPVTILESLPDPVGLPLEVACRVGWDEVELRRLRAVAAISRWYAGATVREIEDVIAVSAGSMERLDRSFRSLVALAQRMAKCRGDAQGVKFLSSIERTSATASVTASEAPPAKRVKVKLLGQGRDRSGRALVNNQRVRLRLASYEILERLVEAARTGEGWLKAGSLVLDGDTDRARKYISQLRTELRPFVDGNPIENGGDGCYRLARGGESTA